MFFTTNPGEAKPFKTKGPKSFSQDERGSTMVEFAVLSPLYVLLFTSLIYFGGLSLAKIDANRSTVYLSSQEGVQGRSDLPENYFLGNGSEVYEDGTSELDALSDSQSDENIYDTKKILEDFDETARRNGSYKLYIKNRNIRDYADEIGIFLNGWMSRSSAEASFKLGLPFEGISDATISSRQEGLIRGSGVRGHHSDPLFSGPNPSDFNQEVVRTILGVDFPDPDERTEEFWIPN